MNNDKKHAKTAFMNFMIKSKSNNNDDNIKLKNYYFVTVFWT